MLQRSGVTAPIAALTATLALTACGSPSGSVKTTAAKAHSTSQPTTPAAGSSSVTGTVPVATSPSSGGGNSAQALANKLGCSGVQMAPKPPAQTHASSAARCMLGKDDVIIVGFASSADRDAGLKSLVAHTGIASSSVEMAEGPNWAAMAATPTEKGTDRTATQQVATKLGGKLVSVH